MIWEARLEVILSLNPSSLAAVVKRSPREAEEAIHDNVR